MSDLSKFALEVASLLDKIAWLEPETASVPGAPFHLAVSGMGKAAKRHLDAMRKQASLQKEGIGLSAILGGLGALGSLAAPPLGAAAVGGAAATGLGGMALHKLWPHIGTAFKAVGSKMAPAAGGAAGAADDAIKALAAAKGLPGIQELIKKNPTLADELTALTTAGVSEKLRGSEMAYDNLLKGVGIGGAGLLGGKLLFDDNRGGGSNLPSVVRYG